MGSALRRLLDETWIATFVAFAAVAFVVTLVQRHEEPEESAGD